MIHQGKRQEAAKEKMASGKGCCCCCWRFIAAWLPSSSSSSCSAASASPFFFFFFFFTISYLPLLRVLLGRGTNLRSLRRRRRQELRATRCTRRFSFRYSEGGGGGVHCLRHQRGFCSITTLGSIIPEIQQRFLRQKHTQSSWQQEDKHTHTHTHTHTSTTVSKQGKQVRYLPQATAAAVTVGRCAAVIATAGTMPATAIIVLTSSLFFCLCVCVCRELGLLIDDQSLLLQICRGRIWLELCRRLTGIATDKGGGREKNT
jgi:hypothetical protein